MDQTKFLLILTLSLGTLIASACASQPAQPVEPIPSVAPASTVMVQPEVSTSIPSVSTPLTAIPPATETPAGPPVSGQKTITLDDRGKTFSFTVGDEFLLQLGDGYTWDISVSDESVISRVKNITVIKGAQGVYTALKPGTATLTASGDPLCRQSKPACGMPSILFEVTLDVK